MTIINMNCYPSQSARSSRKIGHSESPMLVGGDDRCGGEGWEGQGMTAVYMQGKPVQSLSRGSALVITYLMKVDMRLFWFRSVGFAGKSTSNLSGAWCWSMVKKFFSDCETEFRLWIGVVNSSSTTNASRSVVFSTLLLKLDFLLWLRLAKWRSRREDLDTARCSSGRLSSDF